MTSVPTRRGPVRRLAALLPVLLPVLVLSPEAAAAPEVPRSWASARTPGPPTGPTSAAAPPVTRPSAGVWPLRPQPAVVRRFDPPSVSWGRGHRGVDLAGRVGQPVRAAVAGQVSFAGRIAGVGTVAVRHGATRTTYQPVEPTVVRGEPVAAGQPIGRLAWHGTHCSPSACLHWGLLRGEQYLDPLSLVDAPRPVRLLPWTFSPLRRGDGPGGTPAGAAPW